MADWKEHAGADGKKFYHNSKTKESVWSLPDGVTKQVWCLKRKLKRSTPLGIVNGASVPRSSLRLMWCLTTSELCSCRVLCMHTLHQFPDELLLATHTVNKKKGARDRIC